MPPIDIEAAKRLVARYRPTQLTNSLEYEETVSGVFNMFPAALDELEELRGLLDKQHRDASTLYFIGTCKDCVICKHHSSETGPEASTTVTDELERARKEVERLRAVLGDCAVIFDERNIDDAVEFVTKALSPEAAKQ